MRKRKGTAWERAVVGAYLQHGINDRCITGWYFDVWACVDAFTHAEWRRALDRVRAVVAAVPNVARMEPECLGGVLWTLSKYGRDGETSTRFPALWSVVRTLQRVGNVYGYKDRDTPLRLYVDKWPYAWNTLT